MGATVCAIGALGLAGCGTTSSGDAHRPVASAVPPGSSASSVTSAPSAAAAARIVHDPRARLDTVSVIPGHPGRRVAEWYVCRDHHCYRRTYALVVSADGFRTSHVVEVAPSRVANGWYLAPAGPTHFTIAPNGGRRSLVDLTGHVTRLQVAGRRGPLVQHEVAVPDGKGVFLGVDPVTGAAHPLSTPAGVVELEMTSTGQLRALTLDHPRYFWSSDGGTTWHEIPLPAADDHLWAELVPTPSTSLHALVVGGENTVFPWTRVLRSADGRTWTSYDGPTDPSAFVDGGVVLPDGRLLMDVDGWSDQTQTHASAEPVGLWAGTAWAHLEPVATGAPFGSRKPWVVDTVVTPHLVTLYVLTPDQRGVVASRDAGVHWGPVRAR